MTDSVHEWDAAYVLGALGAEDRRRYEAHLAGCAECTEAVRRLAGVPGLLGRVDRDAAVALRDLPDDDRLRDADHRPDRAAGIAARVARRRRRTTAALAAAAVAVLLLGGAVGWAGATAAGPPSQLAAARTLTPVGGSHLTARLSATSVGWGTRFDWSCDYHPSGGSGPAYARPVSYSLVVSTRSGTESTVATWTSDAGEAKNLVAATAIPIDSIRWVDIRVTGSKHALAGATF